MNTYQISSQADSVQLQLMKVAKLPCHVEISSFAKRTVYRVVDNGTGAQLASITIHYAPNGEPLVAQAVVGNNAAQFLDMPVAEFLARKLVTTLPAQLSTARKFA